MTQGISKCDKCGRLWPSAPVGTIHKCQCSGGYCHPAGQSAQSTPPVEREDVCAHCKGVIGDLAVGRDPEELCDTCYEDSQEALTPPPVAVEDDVERLVDLAMRAVLDPSQFVPGYGSDYPSMGHWQRAALRAAIASLTRDNGKKGVRWRAGAASHFGAPVLLDGIGSHDTVIVGTQGAQFDPRNVRLPHQTYVSDLIALAEKHGSSQVYIQAARTSERVCINVDDLRAALKEGASREGSTEGLSTLEGSDHA